MFLLLTNDPQTHSERMNKGGFKTHYNLRQKCQALSSSSGKRKTNGGKAKLDLTLEIIEFFAAVLNLA